MPSDMDPNIATVLNGGPVKPEPTPELDPRAAEMIFEYQWTLPLELKRAEVAHLNVRTGFWNALSTAITAITDLVK
jgi:hypothetical protein